MRAVYPLTASAAGGAALAVSYALAFGISPLVGIPVAAVGIVNIILAAQALAVPDESCADQHSADGWAVPWKDGRDRVRWQPQRPDGRRPWLRDERYYPTDLGWYAAIEDYEGAFGPLLFRSRWQAERMAKRTWNAKLKRELNQVTEVQP